MPLHNNKIWFLNYLHPKFWLVWLAMGLLRLTIYLPFSWQLNMGKSLGRLAHKLSAKRRFITLTNIRLCFPELKPPQQHELLIKSFESSGMAIFEVAYSWWSPRKKLEPLLHIEGLEHIHKALEKGKGVLLLTAHITCQEIAGALLSLRQPYQIVYKKAHDPLFEELQTRARGRRLLQLTQTYELRKLMTGLKKNMVTWYAMDQDFGLKQSVFAPFMGVPTSTLTTPARIIRKSGATLVPYFPRRLADNSGYMLSILPALENFPTGDDVADASRVNALIESAIRQAPEQYLWGHRRFKTRPAGHANVYLKPD